MAKVLNFNNITKKYLTVTLPDKNKTTLMITTPTKATMDNLLTLQEVFESVDENVNDEDSRILMNSLYGTVAEIMSCNKGGVKITEKLVSETFDFEDITIFYTEYIKFVDEVVNSKN